MFGKFIKPGETEATRNLFLLFNLSLDKTSPLTNLSFTVSALTKLFNVQGNVTDIARLGSGSACRSLDGGFVEWTMGEKDSGEDSTGKQIVTEDHWPEMRILILVVSVSTFFLLWWCKIKPGSSCSWLYFLPWHSLHHITLPHHSSPPLNFPPLPSASECKQEVGQREAVKSFFALTNIYSSLTLTEINMNYVLHALCHFATQVSGKKKAIGSSKGMLRSTQTSPFLKHRADKVVPDNMKKMQAAIKSKDFPAFAEVTMKVSTVSSTLRSLLWVYHSNRVYNSHGRPIKWTA